MKYGGGATWGVHDITWDILARMLFTRKNIRPLPHSALALKGHRTTTGQTVSNKSFL